MFNNYDKVWTKKQKKNYKIWLNYTTFLVFSKKIKNLKLKKCNKINSLYDALFMILQFYYFLM